MATVELASEAMSELCKVGIQCMHGQEVYYPGSTFFIDPAGMTTLQLLLIFVAYGYVLFVSANMIGDGAELLLLVPGYDKMVGSIVLPILGAIPDGMMVLFSGVGPLEVAQENVAVGVGALAGSTIMLLTLPWVLAVRAGQVDMGDMKNGKCEGYRRAAGQRKTKGESGCQFGEGVTKNAWLMFITSLSYFVIQIPAYMVDDQKTKAEYPNTAAYLNAVTSESKSENKWALYGIICTLFFFFFYLYLQYLAAMDKEPPIKCLKALLPSVQTVNVDLAKKYGVLPLIVAYRDNFFKTGRMRTESQRINTPYVEEGLTDAAKLPKDLADILRSLFTEYANKTPTDPGISADHMRELLSVIGLNYAPKAFAEKFAKFDVDRSQYLDRGEFLTLFYNMITSDENLPHQQAQAEPESQGGDDDDEEDEMPDEFKNLSPEEQKKQIMRSSLQQMTLGTILVLIFSDPMVDVLAEIGKQTGVSAFYVSFVLAPLASNASELVSSMTLASKKTVGAMTQSLQTLEGAACMNNTFCLGIFYVLIYLQGLAWKFTAETLSIFFVQVMVFLLVIRSNTQSMNTGLIVFACYPLSLVFVAVLEKMGFD